MKIVSAEKKKIVDKLVEDCTKTVEEVKLAKINLAENENKHKCSYLVYIVLMIEVFTICAGIGTYFVYYNWCLVKHVSHIKFNTHTQTTIQFY